ncbi:S1C family serine protease [Paenibacillus xylaniclasticus]|uniref:S1C family serine protease n=1 Tax=Paenibacillus xylaniclasticus TaxID=588083 RepID=UPI000FD8EC3C|nr:MULTISPECIES: S1C family serine protease [Paenibacillus]GFN31336.1 serine protease [Paenibacillus curdlanolyticus]
MSLFDDDFYSSRVSRRKSRWVQEDTGNRPTVLRSRSAWSRIRVAVLSSAISVAGVVLLFGAVSHFNGGGSKTENLAASASVAPTQTQTADPYERTITAAAKVRPTVVSVINEQYGPIDDEGGVVSDEDLQDAGIGSGVIFEKKDGKALIVTNAHVIANAERVKVAMIDGSARIAEVIGDDPITDLAVLQVDGEGIKDVATFGNSSKLRNGEWVMAIGSPLGLDDSLSMGIISKTTRIIPVSLNQDGNYDWEQEVIQIDASINQGNSGGPLIDLDGNVVGINSMKIADFGVEGVGFAIPINNARPIIDSLIDFGVVKRPYLGVYTFDLDQYLAQQALTRQGQSSGEDDEANSEDEDSDVGLILPEGVEDGVIVLEAVGPAKEAGLQFNDLIVKFDKTPIGSTMELRKYLYNHKEIGDTIEITFYRDGELMTVKVKLSLKSKDDE